MPPSPIRRIDHWRRYRRLLAVALVVAGAAVAAALASLVAHGVELRLPLIIAVVAGITGSVMLAGALMGLVFVSARSGHDDAVEYPLNEQGRREGRPLAVTMMTTIKSRPAPGR